MDITASTKTPRKQITLKGGSGCATKSASIKAPRKQSTLTGGRESCPKGASTKTPRKQITLKGGSGNAPKSASTKAPRKQSTLKGGHGRYPKGASIKAPRKQSALKGGCGSSPKGGKSDRLSGGNLYCPRPIPAWQKPITNFFLKADGLDQSAGKKSMEKEPYANVCVESTCNCGTFASSISVTPNSICIKSSGCKCVESSTTISVGITRGCEDFQEPLPSCSKDRPEFMEIVDSENFSSEEDSNQDDSAMNLKSASNNDSKLSGTAVKFDPWNDENSCRNDENPECKVDVNNLNTVLDDGDFERGGHANNSQAVGLDPVPEDVKNLEHASNEGILCVDKKKINYYNVIPYDEEFYDDDDSSSLCENSEVNAETGGGGIDAATIGVNASPTVNDLHDEDSGCIDE